MKKVMLVSIGFSGGKPGGIDRRGVDQVPVVPVLSGPKYRKFSGTEVSSCTPLQDETYPLKFWFLLVFADLCEV